MRARAQSNERVATDSTVKGFFDEVALVRERQFLENPILAYEQVARQQGIRALLSGRFYQSILDAGCGNGRDFELLAKHSGNVMGMDFSAGMIKQARLKRVDDSHPGLMQGDVTALPFQDETFELVVCSEVLEHVPNWGRAVSEIYRILRRGGEVVITTPNRFSIYGLSFSVGRRLVGSSHPYDHWKSHLQIGRALKEAGFKHIEPRGACFLPGPICYFQPLKSLTLLALPLFAYFERLASERYPFYLISYLAVVRATK